MAKLVLNVVGGTLMALGTMWALQGLGILNWPAQSFMLAQRQWAVYGGVTAVIGAGLVSLATRRSK